MEAMTEPQSDNIPPSPPSSDDSSMSVDDFMSTYYTADLIGTENKGESPSAIDETRER